MQELHSCEVVDNNNNYYNYDDDDDDDDDAPYECVMAAESLTLGPSPRT